MHLEPFSAIHAAQSFQGSIISNYNYLAVIGMVGAVNHTGRDVRI